MTPGGPPLLNAVVTLPPCAIQVFPVVTATAQILIKLKFRSSSCLWPDGLINSPEGRSSVAVSRVCIFSWVSGDSILRVGQRRVNDSTVIVGDMTRNDGVGVYRQIVYQIQGSQKEIVDVDGDDGDGNNKDRRMQ